mmetsp:Transcript_50662/g.126127  ORF Transcript_50662/g.126127 Transcript_50662/m.126127 type:complete len:946 (+) Transcript_50662:91-2928(+)
MESTHRVTIIDALGEYTSFDSRSAYICTCCIFVVSSAAYLATSCVLYASLHNYDQAIWEPQVMWRNFLADGALYNDAVDVILCSLLCILVMPLLGLVAVSFGASAETEEEPEAGGDAGVTQPLLAEDRIGAEDSGAGVAGAGAVNGAATSNGARAHGGEGATESEAAKQAKRDAQQHIHDKFLERHKGVVMRQNAVSGLLLFCSSAAQLFVGLKCIGFKFPDEAMQGALMGIGVLWINVMVWCTSEVVKAHNKAEGLGQAKIPELHPHTLTLHRKVHNHWCDKCSTRIDNGKAYRCKLCDFDLCMRCFTRKDLRTSEGLLRGDKGVRREDPLTTMDYFKRALGLAKQEWILFFFALVALTSNNLLQLVSPNLQGSILDAVFKSDEPAYYDLVMKFLAVSALTGVFSGAQSLCFNIMGRRLANTIRNKLFRGMIQQDIAFFDGNTSGQLTSRLSTDAREMVSPIQSSMGSLLSNTIRLIGGVALCFYTSWRLSMLAFTTVGPIITITQVYAAWSQGLNRQIYAALAHANGIATEALGNVRTIKAMSTEEMEVGNYRDSTRIALSTGVRDAWGTAGMNTINSYMDLAANVLVLWYGGWLAIQHDGRMTAGKLITYQLYWNMMDGSYKALIDMVTSFTRAAGAAQRVFSLMDSLPDIDTNIGRDVPAGDLRGAIRLETVGFTYQMRPDEEVIKGLSLDIPAGSTCALVGRSGSGKSTLVHLMLRFYDPSRGSLFLDGVPLTAWNLRQVHRRMAVVAQDTQLFAKSILENLTYGLEPGTWTARDVEQACRDACAHDFISSFPDGYDTRVGERGVRISGGQKQRIAIARCFLRKAKILFLDEATSALDSESEATVQAALDRLMSKGGATVVLVAHRLSTVIGADKIAVMHEGGMVEQGTHKELIDQGGMYFKLVERQIARQSSVIQEGQPDTKEADVVDKIIDQMMAKKG